jgi:hypothetical protein
MLLVNVYLFNDRTWDFERTHRKKLARLKTPSLPTPNAQPEIENWKYMTISFQFFGLKVGTAEV